jgi:thiamine biosynthesis lipoprotein
MNTSVLLAAEGDGAAAGMQAAQVFIDECEQRFSRFLPASELSQLNRSAGSWLQVSNELMEMLQLSMKFYKETNGIFDPSILPDLKQTGYDRSMEEIRSDGATVNWRGSKRMSRAMFDEIRLDPAANKVLLPHDMEIDLGGIAKGWIVEKAALMLNKYTEVCAVSAGGDMLFIGHPLDRLAWEVYLEDPRDPAQMLALLNIESGAVATSSVAKRIWHQGGRQRHHLIDPRTAEPAVTKWLSVTVIAPELIVSEVYAKALLIGGEEISPSLLQQRPEITYLAVDRHGNLSGSLKYEESIDELAANNLQS